MNTESCRSGRSFIGKHKLLLLIIIVYLILTVLHFDLKLFTGGDNAVYIILAESISSGKGYKSLHLPDEPPHTQYPPGFPLLLSLPILLFGTNIITLKLVVVLMSIFALFFMYKICELLFKEKVVLMMAYYVSIPLFITHNHYILSEMPFLCFSLAAVYFFIGAQSGGKTIFYYISFIFASCAFFTRTAGFSLILAIGLFLVLKKQYKYFGIFLLTFLVVFIPWQIRSAGIPGTVGYFDQFFAKNPYHIGLGRVSFFELLARIWQNFTIYFLTILPKTLIPVLQSRVFSTVPGCIFILLVIIGFTTQMQKFSIIELYSIFSVIILVSWPEIWSSERFLLPILPILTIYILSGLFWLAKKISFKYFVETVIGILISLIIAAHIQVTPGLITHNIAYLKGDKYAGYALVWRNYFEVVNWIKDNIPEDRIILSRKPEFVYLLSKHKSLVYPLSDNHDEIKNSIKQSDYIILDRGPDSRSLYAVLKKDQDNYRLVFETTTPKFYLLKVLR